MNAREQVSPMSDRTLSELVEAARSEAARSDAVWSGNRGDSEAFGQLVDRFQDMAVACALGRLPDPELARDAAQEAFLAAFLHLDQLRDPAAFPGWFRRVVWKHCDRILRRRRLATIAMDRAPEPTAATPTPTEAFERGVEHALLRRAIESLPGHERSVVALFYLAGESQSEVAAFLELPVGTVKKRLHSARQRLRQEIPTMHAEQFERLRPSTDAGFARVVRWFVAVRTGDLASVAALLDEDPDLVHRVEDWEPDEAIRTGGPLAERATPLIRAAERNDVKMLDLLLDHGAAVEGDCGC